MKRNESAFNRRQFIGALAATGAVVAACSGNSGGAVKQVDYKLTTLLDKAPDGQEIKAGVIGCGGRGSGAAMNFLDAGSNIKIVALADVFTDRLNSLKKKLQKRGNVVPEDNCFIGLDAFEKLLDLKEINYVILATPPYFRPMMFKAAVEARKNVFMEKPVAVDPVGARSIMASSKKAQELGLNVVCGTQRRHQHHYVSLYKQIQNGAIGDLVSANVYWNGGQLWYRTRKRGWSDLEWMIRDWVNWTWLSGDHIVEQHVHNLDVVYWFFGKHPQKALGFGSRQRRVTGDQFDNFSIDFTYDDGRHVHSMCRQINGCTNNVSEYFSGTKGFARSSSNNKPNRTFMKDKNDSVIWTYQDAVKSEGLPEEPISPYVQEHVDLIWAIRTGNQIVEAENTATSTLTAIMGRISAYTGKETTWEEMMNSDLSIGPAPQDLGFKKKYAMVKKPVIPVPGAEKREK